MTVYKEVKISGFHGVGFTFVRNGVVWDFNTLKKAKAFIDECAA